MCITDIVRHNGRPAVRYHGGPSQERNFRRNGCKKETMIVKYDAWHGIVFGTRAVSFPERGIAIRVVPLIISEHLDRLKEDFHYWATTTDPCPF